MGFFFPCLFFLVFLFAFCFLFVTAFSISDIPGRELFVWNRGWWLCLRFPGLCLADLNSFLRFRRGLLWGQRSSFMGRNVLFKLTRPLFSAIFIRLPFPLSFSVPCGTKGMELQEKKCIHAKPSKGSAGRCSQAL